MDANVRAAVGASARSIGGVRQRRTRGVPDPQGFDRDAADDQPAAADGAGSRRRGGRRPRVRVGIGQAGVSVPRDRLRVEQAQIVVGGAPRLLHHHRRRRARCRARLVPHAQRMSDLVIDRVGPIRVQVAVVGHRASGPPGVIDVNPPGPSVVAGRLQRNVPPALVRRPDGHLTGQRDPEVRITRIDAGEAHLATADPRTGIGQGGIHRRGERLVRLDRWQQTVLDLDRVGGELLPRTVGRRCPRHDVPGAGTGRDEVGTGRQRAGGDRCSQVSVGVGVRQIRHRSGQRCRIRAHRGAGQRRTRAGNRILGRRGGRSTRAGGGRRDLSNLHRLGRRAGDLIDHHDGQDHQKRDHHRAPTVSAAEPPRWRWLPPLPVPRWAGCHRRAGAVGPGRRCRTGRAAALTVPTTGRRPDAGRLRGPRSTGIDGRRVGLPVVGRTGIATALFGGRRPTSGGRSGRRRHPTVSRVDGR